MNTASSKYSVNIMLLNTQCCYVTQIMFSYIFDAIISKTTRIPLLFVAADISVFLETNA